MSFSMEVPSRKRSRGDRRRGEARARRSSGAQRVADANVAMIMGLDIESPGEAQGDSAIH